MLNLGIRLRNGDSTTPSCQALKRAKDLHRPSAILEEDTGEAPVRYFLFFKLQVEVQQAQLFRSFTASQHTLGVPFL